MPFKPGRSAQADVWNQIDHRLVSLKLSQARRDIDRKQPLPVRTLRAGNPFERIMNVHVERAKEWAETVYGIHKEVWEKQGKAKTPDFLRVVLNRAILPAIGASVGGASREIKLTAMRTGRPAGLAAIQQALAIRGEQLKGEWRNRVELEAHELELEHANQQNQARGVQIACGQVASVQESRTSSYPKQRPKSSRDSDPEIIKRRAIVKQNCILSAQGICRLFDESRIPLPKSIREMGSWSRAFKAPTHRHSIESLISRDRKSSSD